MKKEKPWRKRSGIKGLCPVENKALEPTENKSRKVKL